MFDINAYIYRKPISQLKIKFKNTLNGMIMR